MHYQAYQWQHEHGWNASAGFPKRKGLTMTAGKITTRLWDIRGSHFEHRCLHKLVGHRHAVAPVLGMSVLTSLCCMPPLLQDADGLWTGLDDAADDQHPWLGQYPRSDSFA